MERKTTRPRLVQAMMDIWALPDLRRRILFTIGILVVFRFVTHVPLPGVDLAKLQEYFAGSPLFGMLDLFTGGAMEKFSVAALGVYPYITASIIMQLLVPVIPRLQAISQEGELGQQRINRITHIATIPLAALQSYAMIALLRSQGVTQDIVPLTMVNIVVTMIAGTMFLVWLGELITERGIGNGISIIIFAGIVTDIPGIVGRGIIAAVGGNPGGLITYVVLSLAMIVLIVIFVEAHRRIPVQYARSSFRGGRMYRQSGSTYVPLRVNTAGMIPLIFAIALMQLPATVATYFMNPSGQDPNFWNTVFNLFQSNTVLYQILYFALVIGFTLFYTMVIFEQMNLPQTLQQQGGFVPGVRPGKTTADYLNGIIRRITFGGALFLAIVAILPFITQRITGVDLLIQSTAMLIAVGVALDTMKQLEAQLTMRRYEGFLK
ncbi:MAG: preprotein translocase subunit SecY [Dehalococcoidia bacterium]|nr:preprotein translocase subunit SecY [Dehalococcoidia bacterium]MDH4300427.1 preprotein translocase subunit SecY [Dehalococcoidia bacterium]MDH4366567.1 preprotein translocase subunit SecY [Dehalococcoidia bacterium]